MTKIKKNNYYDVVYKTKSGHAYVAKRIGAPNVAAAKRKVRIQMMASKTFQGIITAIKL